MSVSAADPGYTRHALPFHNSLHQLPLLLQPFCRAALTLNCCCQLAEAFLSTPLLLLLCTFKLSYPCQVEVEVLVPFGWPCSSSEQLQLVELACPQLQPATVAELVSSINSNSQLLQGGDLLGLLRAVAEAAEAQLLDAEAANL
jgi:hypothetical protein